MSSSRWVKINPELVKKHRLYGSGGWINLFIALLVIAVFKHSFDIISALAIIKRDIVEIFVLLLAIDVINLILYLWIIFNVKNRVLKTLKKIFFILLLGAILRIIQLLIVEVFYDLRNNAWAVIVWPVFFHSCWMLYFHFSKRSNLNYRHRVKRTDPFLTENWEEIHDLVPAEKFLNTAAPQTTSLLKRALIVRTPWLFRMWVVLQILGIILILFQLTTTQWTFSDLFDSWRWGRRDENWFFLLYLFGPYGLAKAMDWINEAKTARKD